MAALVPITPTRAGATTTGPPGVSASDTVARSAMGSLGATLEIINGGGSTDNMTISDASATITGAAAAANAPSVANAASKVFKLTPDMCDPVTGLITITHSFITSVTYKLYPIG